MADTSARWGISEPASDRHDPADVPLYIRNVVAALESIGAQYGQGTLAARPVSTVGSPGKQGRLYFATDNGNLYYDAGTSWNVIGVTTIAPGSIGTTELADHAVTEVKLALLSVGTGELIDQAVTAAKIANALKPSAGAGAATETLRALGTAAGTAAAGAHETQHLPAGADALPWTTIHGSGTLAARPVVASSNAGYLYYATDVGVIYRSDGSAWSAITGASVFTTSVGDGVSTSIDVVHNLGTQNVRAVVRETASPYELVYPTIRFKDANTITLIFDVAPTAGQYTCTVAGGGSTSVASPAAHASSHQANGSDALAWGTIHGSGTLASRPAASASNSGYRYVATDVEGGTEYQSNGASWFPVAASVYSPSRLLSGHSLLTVDGSVTLAETDLLNVSVPANALGANGKIKFVVQGDHTSAGGGPGWTFRVYLGATKLWDSGLLAFAAGTNSLVRWEGEVINLNATNSQTIAGFYSAGNGTSGQYGAVIQDFSPGSAPPGAVDTTVAQTFRATIQCSAASIKFRRYYGNVDLQPAS